MNIYAKRRAREEDKRRAKNQPASRWDWRESDETNARNQPWDRSGRGDTWTPSQAPCCPCHQPHSPGPSGLS